MNEQWAAYQDSKAFADRVATLYGAGEDVRALQKARYGKLVERFEKRFGAQKGGLCFFSAPGRTEIGGSHTDHNNGRVLAAAAIHSDEGGDAQIVRESVPLIRQSDNWCVALATLESLMIRD